MDIYFVVILRVKPLIFKICLIIAHFKKSISKISKTEKKKVLIHFYAKSNNYYSILHVVVSLLKIRQEHYILHQYVVKGLIYWAVGVNWFFLSFSAPVLTFF